QPFSYWTSPDPFGPLVLKDPLIDEKTQKEEEKGEEKEEKEKEKEETSQKSDEKMVVAVTVTTQVEPFASGDQALRECIQFAREESCGRGSSCQFKHTPKKVICIPADRKEF